MDNSKNFKANGKNSAFTSGPLIDVSSSSSDSLPAVATTISPNAVRNRIGANPAPTSSTNNNHNAHINASSLIPSRPNSAVPGFIQRSSVTAVSSAVSASPSNVVERHLVRRTYEEQSHPNLRMTVGSRLAADTSPSGSTAGDIAPDNFDSLSLQLSPHLNRRSSSTVPSTPIRYPSSQHSSLHTHTRTDDVNNRGSSNGNGSHEDKTRPDGELSDSAALQLQAELKRTLESSNSTFTSLVDLSAPVTKWKRAMSLPQNDFSRAMCHRAVAKSLAQNIRSALRSSPSTIKESIPPVDLLPPPYEAQLQEQIQPPKPQRKPDPPQTCATGKLCDLPSPTTSSPNGNGGGGSEDLGSDDIWVLRESYVEKLEDADRHWKAQQIIEEQTEKRQQSETALRMVEYTKAKHDGNIDELNFMAVLNRRASLESNGDGSGNNSSNSNNNNKNVNAQNHQTVAMEPSSSKSHSARSSSGAMGSTRLRNEASGHSMTRGYHAASMRDHDDNSDFSDRDDEPEAQPSLLRPLSNFLSGRKGAYSKVPTLNEHSGQHRHSASSSYRQPSDGAAGGGSGSGHGQRPQQHRRNSAEKEISDLEALAGGDEYSGDEPPPPVRRNPEDFDTDEETDKLLEKSYQGQRQLQLPELAEHALSNSKYSKPKVSMKEVRLADPDHPSVLLEGVLFRCRYLGSTQLVSDSQPNKAVRMMQAQEAVSRIKAPYGEAQPSTEVDLFISFEKIMVLSTNLQDIIMDHALKTISYVADLDEVVVLMARRRQLPESNPAGLSSSAARGPQLKMLCHVFECEDAHHISDAIGEAFHLAYMAFLRANGIEDPSALREVDMGEENIGPQDIFNDDLPRFVDKNHQRDVVVSKTRGEALGIVVVESGWGSVIPTVVVANMLPTGPAARSGQLNIGDQLLSVNGISLVGLPMTSCQNYIKAAKNQTAVRITLIRCPPVTEVLIKRPEIKYQLGFSVHNGIICSLLRGGIAERGGVRVGHRIIEINGESVVAVSHDRIVNLLSSSIGEIRMKTMPMSIFRLLTGQDVPNYI